MVQINDKIISLTFIHEDLSHVKNYVENEVSKDFGRFQFQTEVSSNEKLSKLWQLNSFLEICFLNMIT